LFVAAHPGFHQDGAEEMRLANRKHHPANRARHVADRETAALTGLEAFVHD